MACYILCTFSRIFCRKALAKLNLLRLMASSGIISTLKLHEHIDASIAPALMDELKSLIAQKDKIKKLVF